MDLSGRNWCERKLSPIEAYRGSPWGALFTRSAFSSGRYWLSHIWMPQYPFFVDANLVILIVAAAN
jgi:hypothetical protein